MNIIDVANLKDDIAKEAEDKVLLEILKCSPSFKIIDVKINVSEGKHLEVKTKKEIEGNVYYKSGYFFESDSADQDIPSLVKRVEESYDYIQELYVKYPEYCVANEKLMKMMTISASMERTCGHSSFNIKGKFCNKLLLPNETDCSFGGGDYEIKRTPKRIDDYIKNISRAIEIIEETYNTMKGNLNLALQLKESCREDKC